MNIIKFIIKEYEFDVLNIGSYTDRNISEQLTKIGFFERNSRLLGKLMPNRNILIRELDKSNLIKDFKNINNWQIRLSDHDVY